MTKTAQTGEAKKTNIRTKKETTNVEKMQSEMKLLRNYVTITTQELEKLLKKELRTFKNSDDKPQPFDIIMCIGASVGFWILLCNVGKFLFDLYRGF